MPFYVMAARYATERPQKAAVQEAIKSLKDAGVRTTTIPSYDGQRYSPVAITEEQAKNLMPGTSLLRSPWLYLEGPFDDFKVAEIFWHNGRRD